MNATTATPPARLGRTSARALAAWLLALVCTAPALCQAQAQAARQSPAAASSLNPPGTLAAPALLRVGLTSQLRLVYKPPASQPAAVAPDIAARPTQASLGLEFKAPTHDRPAALSLLRVQLAGDSMLQFRPRRSGLMVTYASPF